MPKEYIDVVVDHKIVPLEEIEMQKQEKQSKVSPTQNFEATV